MDIATQLASITLYAMLALCALFVMCSPGLKRFDPPVRHIARLFLGMSALLALAFITLQIRWVCLGEYQSLDTVEAVLWLVFDWANALSHLGFVMVVHLVLQWRDCRLCDRGGREA